MPGPIVKALYMVPALTANPCPRCIVNAQPPATRRARMAIITPTAYAVGDAGADSQAVDRQFSRLIVIRNLLVRCGQFDADGLCGFTLVAVYMPYANLAAEAWSTDQRINFMRFHFHDDHLRKSFR